MDGFLFLLDDKNKNYHLCSKRLMVLLQIIYMNQYPLLLVTPHDIHRDSRNINIPFTHTEISRKSCIPSSVSLWNSLEDDICSSSNFSGFTENIKKYVLIALKSHLFISRVIGGCLCNMHARATIVVF